MHLLLKITCSLTSGGAALWNLPLGQYHRLLTFFHFSCCFWGPLLNVYLSSVSCWPDDWACITYQPLEQCTLFLFTNITLVPAVDMERGVAFVGDLTETHYTAPVTLPNQMKTNGPVWKQLPLFGPGFTSVSPQVGFCTFTLVCAGLLSFKTLPVTDPCKPTKGSILDSVDMQCY